MMRMYYIVIRAFFLSNKPPTRRKYEKFAEN
jgi:hypothetical protein